MKLRVLVVDDNQANRMIVRSLLEPSGIDVTLAGNGQDALKEVRSSRFDLVLMDIHMPGMDGCETAGRIRKENGCETIPVIAMTATSGTVSGDSEQARARSLNPLMGRILRFDNSKSFTRLITNILNR